jgi:hypothetical protein
MKALYWLAITGLAMALASCIDGREEIWIEHDGSGRVDVNYQIPASAALLQGGEAGIKKLLQDFLSTTTALSSSTAEVTKIQERFQIRVRASFKSALELQKLTQRPPGHPLPAAATATATALAGQVKWVTHGLTLDYSRALDFSNAMPGAAFLPTRQLLGHKLSYILHLPEAATDSNATFRDATGKTLTWEFPVAELIRKPTSMQFTMPIPLPRWLLVFVGAIAILVAYLAFRFLRRNKCPHAHTVASSNREIPAPPTPEYDAKRPEE